MFGKPLCAALTISMASPLAAQPPSVVFHPDELHFSWCERLADGRFFGPMFDSPECRTLDEAMHQTAAWRYVDPLGGSPVIYNGVLNGPSIVGYGVVRHQPPQGLVQTKMSFTRVSATGEMLQQRALLFDGYYQEYMAAGGTANIKLATNPFDETFAQLRSFEGEDEVYHILKVAADGTPLWQIRLPSGHYIPGPLEADLEGGCWFTTASNNFGSWHPSFQVGRLDADGNVVFWNDYRRTGAGYRDRCTVRANGLQGFIAVGNDDNQVFWMRMNALGEAQGYRLTTALEPMNVLDRVEGVVRVGQEWAVLQGVSQDRLLFFNLGGIITRSYADSIYALNDTLHNWSWNTLDGRSGWAMLTGYRGLHAADGTTYEYRTTLTQLKEEEWDHCLIRSNMVTQELVPMDELTVQALIGITSVALPTVVEGDLLVETIPTYPEELLCASYITTDIASAATAASHALASVMRRGSTVHIPVDHGVSVSVFDMCGRLAMPITRGGNGGMYMPTDVLSAGSYIVRIQDEQGTYVSSQRVQVVD